MLIDLKIEIKYFFMIKQLNELTFYILAVTLNFF